MGERKKQDSRINQKAPYRKSYSRSVSIDRRGRLEKLLDNNKGRRDIHPQNQKRNSESRSKEGRGDRRNFKNATNDTRKVGRRSTSRDRSDRGNQRAVGLRDNRSRDSDRSRNQDRGGKPGLGRFEKFDRHRGDRNFVDRRY
jgi:hypothetical protein